MGISSIESVLGATELVHQRDLHNQFNTPTFDLNLLNSIISSVLIQGSSRPRFSYYFGSKNRPDVIHTLA